jgi:tRNA (uracil-5-)-methyltransferase
MLLLMEMAFCSLCLVFTNYVFYYPGCLPFKLEGILEFPVVNGSCNKCEFSVGYSLEGKKTVEFMLGNFRLLYCHAWRSVHKKES